MPGAFQGTRVDTLNSDPTKLIDYLQNKRLAASDQAKQFALLQQINREHLADRPGESMIESRIQSFELAFRMQTALQAIWVAAAWNW